MLRKPAWWALFALCLALELWLPAKSDAFQLLGGFVGAILFVLVLGFIPCLVLLIRRRRQQIPAAWLGASWAAFVLLFVTKLVVYR